MMAHLNIIDFLSVLSLWVFLGQKRRPVLLKPAQRRHYSSAHGFRLRIRRFPPAKTQNKNAKFRMKKKQHSSSLQYHQNLASENASNVVQRVLSLIFSFFNETNETKRSPFKLCVILVFQGFLSFHKCPEQIFKTLRFLSLRFSADFRCSRLVSLEALSKALLFHYESD